MFKILNMESQQKISKEMLFSKIKVYINDESSLDMIASAYEFAKEKHKGQFRKSGEPYFVHLVAVGYQLALMQAGPQTICAGILHDTIEDCGVTYEQIKEKFDQEVANMVQAVSKISSLEFKDQKEYQAANHRKIFIAMAKDIRVILIKLVDRLHNMRTLNYLPEEKQKRIASETLQVYAPIAHRLGLAEIKNELEDLSFLYLQPEKYHEIATLIENKRSERNDIIRSMILKIDEVLADKGIVFRIFGRTKHIYSVYHKMETKHKRFDEIFDLYAIRVVTETKLDCYEILGYIHASFKPVNGRLKDYIAMPKMNMYQSLHTTILDEEGNIFEIQIRTEEMDEIAEKGVAAHWAYKEGKYNSIKEQQEIENKLSWFKDMATIMDESKLEHPTEFMDQIQKDIFEANVYVMSPKGRIIELPNGSTPLDFAYRIHTDIGHQTIGAIVNGALVPLNTVLKTGDVINIKTDKNTGPSEDWLKIVKTNLAKNKIKAFLLKKEDERRDELVANGEKILNQELTKRGFNPEIYTEKSKLESIYGNWGINNHTELMYAIATKSVNLVQVIEKLTKQKPTGLLDSLSWIKFLQGKKTNQNNTKSKASVNVSNIDNMKIQMAGCCHPIYGDEIVGYITKGKGVTIHRKDCSNVSKLTRLIDVQWQQEDSEKNYETYLELNATDRNYLISDIVTCLSQAKVTLLAIKSELLPDKVNVDVQLKITVRNLEQLTAIIANLKKINSIYNVNRVDM